MSSSSSPDVLVIAASNGENLTLAQRFVDESHSQGKRAELLDLTSLDLPGVQMATDIGSYLNFVTKMFFAFGVAFEIPVATLLLILTGLTTTKSLANKRPYIILGCFVIGMLLTPPDVVSQLLLAIPAWILFEVGILFGRMVEKNREEVM